MPPTASMAKSSRIKPQSSATVIRIEPSRGWASLKLRELWEYRELLYLLAWRDIKIRYKQTVLGAAWAIIQPFFSMVVFSLFFGHLAKMSSDGVPYPIFSYTALVPWMFFANGLNHASSRLVSNGNLIKKVYFPRLLIPTGCRTLGSRGFYARLCRIVRHDALLWHRAYEPRFLASTVLTLGFRNRSRCRIVALSHERAVQRHTIYSPFSDPILVFFHAYSLLQQFSS